MRLTSFRKSVQAMIAEKVLQHLRRSKALGFDLAYWAGLIDLNDVWNLDDKDVMMIRSINPNHYRGF